MDSIDRDLQQALCDRYGAVFMAAPKELKIGIALNVREGVLPINGVRLTPEGDTTGWYIWAGTELSDAADFFKPLHVAHVNSWSPQLDLTKYLGLSPGWRFLTDGKYEDVWFDPTAVGPKD